MAQSGSGSWDPGMRASDADRERVVAQLREHHTAGRLTLDEFEERMTSAYAAKTYGDLTPLTRDLPIDLATLGPGADSAARYKVKTPREEVHEAMSHVRDQLRGELGALRSQRHDMRHDLRSQRPGHLDRHGPLQTVGGWISLSILLTVIWLVSSLAGADWTYFWPIWPIGIMGALLLTGKIGGRGRR